MVIRFFIPATTANDLRLPRIFYPRFYPLHLFSYFHSWERASIFAFECSVLNKGTAGTVFITSLVWRGAWLGIEPGTSRSRSKHSTTRLSRKRYLVLSHVKQLAIQWNQARKCDSSKFYVVLVAKHHVKDTWGIEMNVFQFGVCLHCEQQEIEVECQFFFKIV